MKESWSNSIPIDSPGLVGSLIFHSASVRQQRACPLVSGTWKKKKHGRRQKEGKKWLARTRFYCFKEAFSFINGGVNFAAIRHPSTLSTVLRSEEAAHSLFFLFLSRVALPFPAFWFQLDRLTCENAFVCRVKLLLISVLSRNAWHWVASVTTHTLMCVCVWERERAI